jgi:hypothetical protein
MGFSDFWPLEMEGNCRMNGLLNRESRELSGIIGKVAARNQDGGHFEWGFQTSGILK